MCIGYFALLSKEALAHIQQCLYDEYQLLNNFAHEDGLRRAEMDCDPDDIESWHDAYADGKYESKYWPSTLRCLRQLNEFNAVLLERGL